MLVSPEYTAQQQQLHEGGVYGGMGEPPYGRMIAEIVNKLDVRHLLDYGCGSRLSLLRQFGVKQLIKHPFKYQAYVPCVERYETAPVPAEMVVCLDVLEHIEEDCIDEVLDHMMRMDDKRRMN